MSDRALARLGVSLALAYTALAVIAIVLAILTRSTVGTIGLTVGLGGFAIVGSILAARRPRSLIGWLFLGASLAGAAFAVCAGLATYGLVIVPGSIPLASIPEWLAGWFGLALGAFLFFSILVFPSGRLPSARWRPVASTCGLFILLTGLVGEFGLKRFGGEYSEIENPLLIPAVVPIAETLGPLLAFSALVFLLAVAAASLVWRYVSASIVERRQLKWVALGVLLMVALHGVSALASPLREPTRSVALNVPPAAIAILRHRLYDIDHLLSRTLVYGATTGLIAALFFVVVALQPILRPLTSGTELAVAASTLLAFAPFQPIRRRIQEAVDRRFDRSRYDAARTLDAFTEDLRDEVDLDNLRADLISAVRETMAPAHASLWLRERGR